MSTLAGCDLQNAAPLVGAIEKLSDIIRGKSSWDNQRMHLLEQCQQISGSEVCAIFLVHGSKVTLDCDIGYHNHVTGEISPREVSELLTYEVTLPNDANGNPKYDGITGYVARCGTEVSIENEEDLKGYKDSGIWKGRPDSLGIWNEENKFRCLFAVPLKIQDQTIGVLKVENKRDLDGTPTVFSQMDKQILRALGNLFSIAVRLSNFKDLPYDELLSITLTWLESYDRQGLYQNIVELCAKLFKADVCSLFVRTKEEGQEKEKVILVAGRLKDGRLMSPKYFADHAVDASFYNIGIEEGGAYDGLTGEIATMGNPIVLTHNELEDFPSHKGKWNEVIWPNDDFGSMAGVPLKIAGNETIGVLKIERSRTHPEGQLQNKHIDMLAKAASELAKHVDKFIDKNSRHVGPDEDVNFRLIRAKAQTFNRTPIDDVYLEHHRTSICQSDLAYFQHHKDTDKLNSRLPMVLGHETVGIVLRKGPDTWYRSGDKQIETGDKVFVIPQRHCGTCHVCENTQYGENYCPSVKFMASTIDGSLSSVYRYNARLILKLPELLTAEPELAIFSEPMANMVQLVHELGFQTKMNKICLDMKPHDHHDFEYFHLKGDSFTKVFNTITAEEPNPRSLFVCKAVAADPGKRLISQQNIMIKGLGLLGQSQATAIPEFTRIVANPKVLIFGTSVSALLLVLVLIHVYNVAPKNIYLTGRTRTKLDQIRTLTGVTGVTVGPSTNLVEVLNDFVHDGFDVAFECVGGEAVELNIDVALKVLKMKGVLGLFGLTEKMVEIDFSAIVEKNIFLKGSWRAAIKAYEQSLHWIGTIPEMQGVIRSLIDDITVIRKQTKIHNIENEEHLAEVFQAALGHRETLSRIVIGNLNSTSLSGPPCDLQASASRP